jgi:hypothetical protein
MQDLKNIETSRNTEQSLNFYRSLESFIETTAWTNLEKVSAFPVFTPRQTITSFVERYELYKLIQNVPGSIFECGVAGGFGLMSFAHLCSIFEPYHYTRKIIGFDTFEGFTEPHENDRTSKAAHLKKGGLSFDSFEVLTKAAALYDQNRALGHMSKIELVKGDISVTLPNYLEKNPYSVVAMLYLDLDLYQPTLTTIKALINRVPKGGVIVFDEINHRDYPGETIAVIEALGIPKLRMQRLSMSAMTSYAIVE